MGGARPWSRLSTQSTWLAIFLSAQDGVPVHLLGHIALIGGAIRRFCHACDGLARNQRPHMPQIWGDPCLELVVCKPGNWPIGLPRAKSSTWHIFLSSAEAPGSNNKP